MNIEQPVRRFNTIHINLWGNPGVGKSGVGGKLYGELKSRGFEAILVQDRARELALQGRLAWRDHLTGEIQETDQFLVSSEQYRRQSELDGLVEVIVSDAPLIQQMIFAPVNYAKQLSEVFNQLTVGWNNIDVLLERDISADYSSLGRVRSAEESVDLLPEIMRLLKKYRPEFITIPTENAEMRLLEVVIDQLHRQRVYRASP